MNHALYSDSQWAQCERCISLCPSPSQGAGASSSACESEATPRRRCEAPWGLGAGDKEEDMPGAEVFKLQLLLQITESDAHQRRT